MFQTAAGLARRFSEGHENAIAGQWLERRIPDDPPFYADLDAAWSPKYRQSATNPASTATAIKTNRAGL